MAERQPMSPKSPAVKQARKWLRKLHAEAQARANYEAEHDERRKAAKRKTWRAEMHELAILPIPSDEALKLARK